LKREEDVFVGVRDLLRIIPGADGGHMIDLILELQKAIVEGGVKEERRGLVIVEDDVLAGTCL
jgi:hypothetical protein